MLYDRKILKWCSFQPGGVPIPLQLLDIPGQRKYHSAHGAVTASSASCSRHPTQLLHSDEQPDDHQSFSVAETQIRRIDESTLRPIRHYLLTAPRE
ncbi:hypothetical protein RIEGSTA812A_PEG_490 [invertebrate metagenome]|uniref:Uncharacterized protein n=1 Tax=invertebrate metagenome TaxID=1711999 RepID=A0A484H541_9ZZZZ